VSVLQVIGDALAAGYRCFDCAQFYENEVNGSFQPVECYLKAVSMSEKLVRDVAPLVFFELQDMEMFPLKVNLDLFLFASAPLKQEVVGQAFQAGSQTHGIL